MKKGPFRLRSQSAVRKRGFKHMGSTFRDTNPHTEGHDHDDTGNIITWDKEKLISDVTKETDVDITRTRGYETKGKSKGYTVEKTIQQAFEDWKKNNPGGTYEEFKAQKDAWIEEQKKEHTKGREEVDVTEKEKAPCSCTGKKPDGTSFTLSYPCDDEDKKMNAEMRCKETTTTKENGSDCQCMNTKTREMISYKCPDPGCKCPKPAECAPKKNGGGGKKKKKKKRRKLNLKWSWKKIKGKLTKICQGEDCPAYD